MGGIDTVSLREYGMSAATRWRPGSTAAVEIDPYANPGCTFCQEIVGSATPLHQRLLPGTPSSRVLHESREAIVVPSLGALTPGHLLIVTRQHHLSFFSAPARARREALELIECLSNHPVFEGGMSVFEHGTCVASRRSQCVEHAHLHVLPFHAGFIPSARRRLRTSLECSLEGESPVGDLPYLLVGSCKLPGERDWMFAHPEREPVPSQMLRQVYAACTGRAEQWDWRRHVAAEYFDATIRAFQDVVRVPEAGSRSDSR